MAKILLVEDDNNLREIYEARLQAEGYDIVSARDGEEALTVAMKERPDLIISDVMMPKISGFDMLDIIRSTEETKDAKVIMMTALSQAEDKQRAEKLGADRYLVKSQVTLEDVAKVAREVLGGESAPAKSTDTPAQTKTEEATMPEPAPAADTPTPVPAPEPATATSSPTPTPAPLPTTDDTSTSDPASTPADQSQAPAASTPATEDTNNIAMTSVTATDDAADDKTSDSDQKTEENAIAEQIESFLDTKSGASEKAQATPAPPTEAPKPETPKATPEVTKTEEADEQTPQSDTEKVKKKVIAPINDPLASSAPNLEKLAEKEKEKEEMQQIANDIAAGNAPRVASQSDATPQPTDDPKPEPTIPHDKGTSIDGVVQPQGSSPEVKTAPQEQPASSDNKSKVDPNSIAL